MNRHAFLVLLGAVAMVGCQNPNNAPNNAPATNPSSSLNTSNEPSVPPATQPAVASEEMHAERAAYAARVQYPVGEASNDLHLTALIARSHADRVEVINPTDKSIDNASIWVNGKYVTYVAHIPARSVLKLERKQFYDNTGHALDTGNVPANQVQVQVGDRLFNVMGPAFE